MSVLSDSIPLPQAVSPSLDAHPLVCDRFTMAFGAGSKGMVCPGRLRAPFARPGFVVSLVNSTIGLPCPGGDDACRGGNLSCRSGYAGNLCNASCAPSYAGNRCARCAEGHFILYNKCKQCGITGLIWTFSVVLPIVAAVAFCRLMWTEAARETRFLATIPLLSTLQIIGVINNINAAFPDGVAQYINIASVAQLNLEIMQLSCVFGEPEDAYYGKVRIFFWLPIVLAGTLCLVYIVGTLFWRMTSEASASATDRTQRFRDRLCNVGCCVFNTLYVSVARLAKAKGSACGISSAGTHR